MADEQQALIQRGLEAGQGRDIFELAEATRRRQPPPTASAERSITPGTGIGIIDIFTAPARRRAATTERIESRAEQAGNLLDIQQLGFEAPGLQADEQLLLDSLADPATRGATLGELRQRQIAQGINLDPQSTFNLDQSRLLAPGKRALQEQAIVASALGIDKARIDLQKSTFDLANVRPPVIDLTKPQAVYSPFTNTGQVAFLPGTVEHTKEQTKLNSLQNLLKDVSDATVDIETFGSERWNDEAVGRMRSRQAGLLIRLNTAREAGVPSGPELELAALSLPDVTDYTAQFGIGRKDRWLEAYRQVERELTRSIMGEMSINPMLHLDYSLLNPADVSPELQEFYQANAPTMQSVFGR